MNNNRYDNITVYNNVADMTGIGIELLIVNGELLAKFIDGNMEAYQGVDQNAAQEVTKVA